MEPNGILHGKMIHSCKFRKPCKMCGGRIRNIAKNPSVWFEGSGHLQNSRRANFWRSLAKILPRGAAQGSEMSAVARAQAGPARRAETALQKLDGRVGRFCNSKESDSKLIP